LPADRREKPRSNDEPSHALLKTAIPVQLGGSARRGREVLAFSADLSKQPLSFQLVERSFVDVLVHAHLQLGCGSSLGKHFQNNTQALVGYPRREGEDRSVELIGLLHQRGISLL
jgi:hypothetical protein